MTNGNLQNAANFDELAEIVKIQIVTGIDAQSSRLSGRSRAGKPLEYHVAIRAVESCSVGFRVQFNAVGAEVSRVGPLCTVCIHEKAHSGAQAAQFSDDGSEPNPIRRETPAVIGRGLVR